MMNALMYAMHPTFDELSAFADLSDVGGKKTRVGRHVSRCARCRDTLEDIRALGIAVRASSSEGAPSGLWHRIERAARGNSVSQAEPRETLPPDAPEWEIAPSLRPTGFVASPFRARPVRWLIGVAAAVIVVGAVLLWPNGRSLGAASVSRLTFSPARPVPGGILSVRYQPVSWLKGQPRLVLVGSSIGSREVGYRIASSLSDSIASLQPSPDGSFEARVRLPNDFVALQLAVSDSASLEVDTDGYYRWLVIGGTPDGRPSLVSFRASAEVYRAFGDLNRSVQPRQRVDPADSLKRYFPSNPAGWAYSRSQPGSGSAFSRLVAFFRSSERKYLSFHEALWPRTDLSADQLHDMYVFANTISEPGEVNRWAGRFAKEHPEDPRAFGDLVDALHQLELREPPQLADSIRPWFVTLDSIYSLARLDTVWSVRDAYMTTNGISSLLSRYADSVTIRAWQPRFEGARRLYFWYWGFEPSAQRRKLAERDWLRAASSSCVRPAGKFSVARWGGDWVTTCQRDRVFAFTFLSQARLLDGDARSARAYADSALTAPLGTSNCARYFRVYEARAKANLALGDTAAARADLVLAVAIWPQDGARRDSASALLGSRFNASAFDVATDSTRRAFAACASRVDIERRAAERKRSMQ